MSELHCQHIPAIVFECAMCHNTFVLSRSDSESRAEAAETWGTHPDKWQGGTKIACGPCYQKIDPATHPEEAAIAKKEGL